MGKQAPPLGIPDSIGRAMARIFLIVRTRNVYGYNSIVERIFRSLLDAGSRRGKPGGSRRCTNSGGV